MRDQFIRIVMILAMFNLVYFERFRAKEQQKLWVKFGLTVDIKSKTGTKSPAMISKNIFLEAIPAA